MSYLNENRGIKNFKNGDVITRIAPIYTKTSYGEAADYSLVGQKFIFLGIANACIYLERTSNFQKMMQGQTFFIPEDLYYKGWDYYEEPKFLEGKGDLLSVIDDLISTQSKAALIKKKKKAIQEEDYETVAKIDKKLKEIEKKERKNMDFDNESGLFGGMNIFGGMGGLNMDDINPGPGDYDPDDEEGL